jgi:hypothetical protein
MVEIGNLKKRLLLILSISTAISVGAVTTHLSAKQSSLVIHSAGLSVARNDAIGSARQLVEAALDRVGGIERARRVHFIKTTERRIQFHVYDSEHNVPPFAPDFSDAEEMVDLQTPASKTTTRTAAATGSKSQTTLVYRAGRSSRTSVFDDKEFPAAFGPEPPYWILQNPIAVLLRALDAPDLTEVKDTTFQGILHHRVSFTNNGFSVLLLLNAENGYLAAVELVGTQPWDMFWNAWGDVHLRIAYFDWHLEAGGIHYPHQWAIYFNEQPWSHRSLEAVAINPPIAATEISLPAGAEKATYLRNVDEMPLGRPDRPIQEIAPGVVQIPGSWYTTLVRQDDGIVVIEAPISSGYSAKVIAEAARRFPGVPVKAVITTNNLWWHFAGLREYVARSIPVYLMDHNKELITRLLESPHTLNPDSLALSHRKGNLISVSQSLAIGSGTNRIVLYPIRTATAQMMMAYLPADEILYSSEMAQPLGPGGSFIFPQSLWELMRAVETQHLIVKTVIGMHMSPTPWQKVTAAVSTASRPQASISASPN